MALTARFLGSLDITTMSAKPARTSPVNRPLGNLVGDKKIVMET